MAQTISRTLLYLSVLSNMILGGVIALRLNVTPADVIYEVRAQALAAQVKVQELELRVTALTSVVSTHAEQQNRFEQWCVKAKELNPSLNVPDILRSDD